MLLQVRNLKTQFPLKNGTVNAVDGIDFEIAKGEVLAIVGESGSGKSVTSLSVMGLVPSPPGCVVEGKIYFHGEDLLKKSTREMQDIRGDRISMIFQEPMTSLNPVFTIGKQIMEALIRHKKVTKAEALEEAIQMLELVGIPSARSRIHDYPHQMSGGMRQRVMIAMALSCNPELLIADEPTTALDVTIQAQILDLMMKLKEKLNMSILLITHDLGIVAETASRVLVMYCGKVVEKGTVAELFSDPLHPYTRGLLNSIPRMDEKKERLYMIPGMVPNPLHMPEGCAFRTRCNCCMPVCAKSMPPLVSHNGREVRCFLYSGEKEGNDCGSVA
jgi:oligopeptide/dipeptide ABC transporter ATP-binding protein